MSKSSRPNTTVVWLLLMGATVLSFALAEKSGAAARVATSVAILIGAFKARCIFIYFMEVTWEPKPFRIVYELWTVVASVLILGGYWFATLHS